MVFNAFFTPSNSLGCLFHIHLTMRYQVMEIKQLHTFTLERECGRERKNDWQAKLDNKSLETP